MSSTNKTANLQLNQWVGTDPVLMADFNADNAKIDAAVQNINNAIALLPHVAAGKYTGTGNYGSENKNRLQFDFVPKLLYISYRSGTASQYNSSSIYGTGGEQYTLIPYAALVESFSTTYPTKCTFYVTNNEGTLYKNIFSLSNGGKTLEWYSTDGHKQQLNSSDKTYYWIAIG